MPKVVPIDDAAALDAAATALQAGEPIVLPTDTVYGLAALPNATEVLSALKGRPESVPIAVLVGSVAQAEGLVEMTAIAERLTGAFWPGPLTVVLLRRGGGDTLGVRCPAHPFVRALADRVGPLAVTSANEHGQPTAESAADAAASLAGPVAVVIDGGRCAGVPSTVVDATGARPSIIRVGPITREQIQEAALR